MINNVLDYILKAYLKSSDYNGCRVEDLYDYFPNTKLLKKSIIELLKNKEIDLYYCNINPYIKNLDLKIPREQMIKFIEALPNEYQKNNLVESLSLENLIIRIFETKEENPFFPISLFPSSKVIKKYIKNKPKYINLPPFNKMLLEGMAHLHFLYFRIDVLNRFLNDPRYVVYNYDYTGSIYYADEVDNNRYEDDHRIYLPHFGLGYNKKTKENAVVIFPHDLRHLSFKHQCYFYSYMLRCQKDYIPEYAYYQNVMGETPKGISIFDAFIQEMLLINKMFKIICGRSLFSKIPEFSNNKRPEYFHSFLSPTQSTYCNFCRTLYRIVIDQLNKKTIIAFAKKLNVYSDELKELGTMSALEETFNKGFVSIDGSKTGTEIINIWKKEIHESRNIQSHSFIDDKYDIEIYAKYRTTLQDAYESIRLIRLVLSVYPIVKNAINNKEIEISEDLYYGKINTYFL